MCIDEPAVYIFVKREAEVFRFRSTSGQTSNLQRRFGVGADRCPDEWRRAMAAGMTHVHVRFDPCTARARQLEARDLVAALRPPSMTPLRTNRKRPPIRTCRQGRVPDCSACMPTIPQRMSLVPAAAAARRSMLTAHALRPGRSLSRLDPAREESIDDPEVAAVAEAGVTEAGVTEAGVADGIAIRPRLRWSWPTSGKRACRRCGSGAL